MHAHAHAQRQPGDVMAVEVEQVEQVEPDLDAAVACLRRPPDGSLVVRKSRRWRYCFNLSSIVVIPGCVIRTRGMRPAGTVRSLSFHSSRQAQLQCAGTGGGAAGRRYASKAQPATHHSTFKSLLKSGQENPVCDCGLCYRGFKMRFSRAPPTCRVMVNRCRWWLRRDPPGKRSYCRGAHAPADSIDVFPYCLDIAVGTLLIVGASCRERAGRRP